MASRDVALGIVAVRAERRARTARLVAWLALAVSALALAVAIWRP